jgi:hypothetical protein
MVGTPTYTNGKYGQGIQFTNTPPTSSQALYYTIPSDVGSMVNGLTLSFWLNPQSLPNPQNQTYVYIDGPMVGSTGAFWMFMNNGTSTTALLYGQNPSAGGYFPGVNGPTVPQGSWTHMTGVWTPYNGSSNVMTLYVNGVFAQSIYYANAFTINRLTLATNAGGRGSPCTLDDLRIYNSALTSAQVQAIYNQQGVPGRGALVPQSPQPSLMWQFESSNVDSVTGLAPSSSIGTLGYTPGKYGQAAFFNQTPGTTPTLSLTYTLPPGITANNCTISFWLKPYFAIPSSSGNQQFVSFVDSQVIYYMGFNSQASTTRAQIYYYNGSNNTLLGGSPTTQVWFHTVGVLSNVGQTGQNSNWTYYFNGVSGGSFVVNKTGTSPITSLYVGSAVGTNLSSYMAIDDLRVFNTALTAAQVQAIYATSGMPSRQVLSGTPLFTQLSPSAVASSVGAFSLRAVNGITAKVVQVRRVPSSAGVSTIQFSIIGNQFSRADASPTPPDTSVAGQVTYNGTNQYTRINSLNLTPTTTGMTISLNFKLNSSAASQYILKMFAASASQGTVQIFYNGTNLIFEGFSGSSGTYYNMGQYTASTSTNYYIVAIFNGPVISIYINNVLFNTQTISASLINSSYTLFGLGSENSPGGFTSMTVYDFRIMNTVLTASDIVATDFYADRLGNLLTAPVVGQTLANWLGGATGYVTTWYDQSGRGNHATQATAANQPIITRATKGPGYSALFNGTSTIMTLNAGANLDNTNYSVCAASRRNKTGEMYYVGTNGPSSTRQQLSTGYYTDTSTIINEQSYALVGVTIPGYSVGSEPMGYDFYNFSQTNGMYIYNWRSGTSYASGNSGLTSPMTSSGSITIGFSAWNGGNKYFSGEMYEILVLTSSLFDLSGSTPGTYTTPPSIIQSIYNNQLGAYGT